MRWLVEVTIGAMLDERSRRAIEETLLDWAHEADQAQGPLAAVRCHAGGMLGFVRLIASVVLYQVPQLLTSV